jgi:hypothetical protein
MTVKWKAILLSVTLSPSQYTYESYEPKIAQTWESWRSARYPIEFQVRRQRSAAKPSGIPWIP